MKVGLCVSAAISLLAYECPAATLTVSAQANIFGAGHSSAPGGGQLPPTYSFVPGRGLILTFSNVLGTVSSGADSCGPDGAQDGPSTDMNSTGGISGIKDSGSGFFLVGVFLGESEPANPSPARLDFSSAYLTEDFSEISPGLNQTFFVGNGFVGTNTQVAQRFVVPEGATRLCLGFADGNPTGVNSDQYNYHGSPGYFGDNSGSLTASFEITQQPFVTLARAVKPVFNQLSISNAYQLQISPDLINWTNQGTSFIATNSSMVYPQYWDVDNWGQFFFRLQPSAQ